MSVSTCRVVGGGAFTPYVSDKTSLRGWAGSLGHDVSHRRVAQETLLTPVCHSRPASDRGRGLSCHRYGSDEWWRPTADMNCCLQREETEEVTAETSVPEHGHTRAPKVTLRSGCDAPAGFRLAESVKEAVE